MKSFEQEPGEPHVTLLASALSSLPPTSFTRVLLAELWGEKVDEDNLLPRLIAWAVLEALAEGHPSICLESYAERSLQLGEERRLSLPPLAAIEVALEKDRCFCVAEGEAALSSNAPFIVSQGYVYLHKYFAYEYQTAQALRARLDEAASQQSDSTRRQRAARLEAYFPKAEADDRQKLAAERALSTTTLVISGGPGTGKTTTVAKILGLLSEEFQAEQGRAPRVLLTAPTGKAAARLNESIAQAIVQLPLSSELKKAISPQAQTLHSALRYRLANHRNGGSWFEQGRPLPYDVVLLDEASMIDLALMSTLLARLHPRTRLILLGDRHQLASVEAGSVFAELCAGLPESCLVELTKSYRFDVQRGIGRLARAINGGDSRALATMLEQATIKRGARERDSGQPELSFISLADSNFAWQHLKRELKKFLSAALSAGSAEEALQAYARFRMLSPYRNGPLGVVALNEFAHRLCREMLGTSASENHFRGELVMVTENDPGTGLRNGDVGVLFPRSLAQGEQTLVAYFEDRKLGTLRSYSLAQVPRLEPAFCTTVHKSQGSEFEQVFYLGSEVDSKLLTRELFYTAVTRAKKHVVVYGEIALLQTAASRRVERDSRLAARLQS